MVNFKTRASLSRKINSTLCKGLTEYDNGNFREWIESLTIEKLQEIIPSYRKLQGIRGIGETSIDIIQDTLVSAGFPGISGYPSIGRIISMRLKITGTSDQLTNLIQMAEQIGVTVIRDY